MGVKSALSAVALGLALTGLVSACSSTAVGPPPLPQLAVGKVAYDCSKRQLVVTGQVIPPAANRNIQVQVRSIENPRAPVWRIAATNSAGQFRAAGTYAVSEKKAVELVVRLASVAQGARIFSPRSTHMVKCAAPK